MNAMTSAAAALLVTLNIGADALISAECDYHGQTVVLSSPVAADRLCAYFREQGFRSGVTRGGRSVHSGFQVAFFVDVDC